MSENKYYTPTLEELLSFIVNEKYISSKEDNIIKFNDITTDLRYFIQSNDVESGYKGRRYLINPEHYKIKYLDTHDIESFGFEHNTCMDETFHIGFNKEDFTVIIFKNSIDVVIYGKDNTIKLFEGKVKNKSELKKILQMIGILTNE